MRRSPTLPKLQNLILEQLAQVQYATSAQLQHLCGAQQPDISRAVTALIDAGLIDGRLLTRPMILHLTPISGKLLGIKLPARRQQASWSVMAQACHLNELQALMHKKHAGFRYLSRVQLLKQGFNPAFGEHAAIDDAGTSWFVLLDDYQMTSDRISRAWTRRHTPSRKYWPDPTGRTWCDVAQRFLVVSTDEQHMVRHREWILKTSLPADVMHIKPLWKL